MIDCATIKDLLPLYVDDVLSRESKALVSGHLATCESCKNEFVKMQSEFVKLPPNDGDKIDVLKSMKKKIFRQKAKAAAVASVVAIVVVLIGVWFVFLNDNPIKYEQDLIRVERSESLFDDNGTITTQMDLNIISVANFHGSNSLTRKISVNDTEIEVMYFYLTETMFTKWRSDNNGNRSIRLAGAGENMTYTREDINYPSLPLEIYYMVASFHDMLEMNDEDFYAQRNNGVLLWSGTLVAE